MKKGPFTFTIITILDNRFKMSFEQGVISGVEHVFTAVIKVLALLWIQLALGEIFRPRRKSKFL
jgi:hypothetical protein